MRLNEIKFFQDKYDDQFSLALHRFVREKGLNLSQGGQARVVWIEGKNWVWRAWFNDRGYERFLKYVEAHPGNPHLPKILSRVREEPVQFKGMPKDMTMKYIKLEKLDEIEIGNFSDAIDSVMQNFSQPPKNIQEIEDAILGGKIPKDSDGVVAQIAREVLQHGKFFETFIELMKEGANDITSGNVMMRGVVPVIIDPFSHD